MTNLPGYDAWKTREPDYDDEPACRKCGGWMQLDRTRAGRYYYCERCDEEVLEEPDPDYALEAKRDALMWERPAWDDSDDPEPPF